MEIPSPDHLDTPPSPAQCGLNHTSGRMARIGNELGEGSSTLKNMGGGEGSGGGFRARAEHYLYSGDKKHVFVGIAIISVIFGVPWYLMNRGTKHQSHQDYMERADKARSQRLSSGQPSVR